MNKLISNTLRVISISSLFILGGCSTQIAVQSDKVIKLNESINRPLILANAQVGLYQKIGMTDDYELYVAMSAKRTNFTGNKHNYIGVRHAGTPESEVCLPDSMNFFHCSKKSTTIITEETETTNNTTQER